MQNGYIEKFNRVYRKAILDAYLFTDICEFRSLTEEWIEEYNERRPQVALKNRTPTEWKQQNQSYFNNLNLSGKRGTYNKSQHKPDDNFLLFVFVGY